MANETGESDRTIERRTTARARVRTEVRYRLAGQSAVHAWRGWSQDLSTDGLRFAAEEPLAIGQELHIALRHPVQGAWLPETRGIVIWQSRGTTLSEEQAHEQSTGLSFSKLDRAMNHQIQGLLVQQGAGTLKEQSIRPDSKIGFAYDGSTVTYRLLRAFGWGSSINLGYFQFPSPFSILNVLMNAIFAKTTFLLPEAQTRLIKKSADLLEIQGTEQVLDIACGRGKGSYVIANLHSSAHITAIDLLPDNIHVASTLFSNTPNLRFMVDDALCLQFDDGCIDKALCLEAAFHFPSRVRFLKEAFRVLRGGGRLVLVDFAWKTDEDRSILNDEETRLVRHIWRWDDFYSVSQYLDVARTAGFEVAACHDWSRRVTIPMAFIFKLVAWLGCNRLGRFLLIQLNPLLCGMPDAEWAAFQQSARAHNHVGRHAKYIALVLKKPK